MWVQTSSCRSWRSQTVGHVKDLHHSRQTLLCGQTAAEASDQCCSCPDSLWSGVTLAMGCFLNFTLFFLYIYLYFVYEQYLSLSLSLFNSCSPFLSQLLKGSLQTVFISQSWFSSPPFRTLQSHSYQRVHKTYLCSKSTKLSSY